MANDTVIVTKMTVKTIGCNAKDGSDERTLLCRIFGIASGIKVAEGKDGDILYGLTGDFRGINAKTPETTYHSGVLYLPGGVNEMLVAAVDTGELDAKDKPIYGEVKFAFDLYSKPANNPAGYQYEAVPVVDTVENDAMAELASQLPAFGASKPAIADEATGKKSDKK